MDGASNFRIFIEIIMPLSAGGGGGRCPSAAGRCGFFHSPAPFCAPGSKYTLPSGFITWWRKKWVPATLTYAAGAVLMQVPVAIPFTWRYKILLPRPDSGSTQRITMKRLKPTVSA